MTGDAFLSAIQKLDFNSVLARIANYAISPLGTDAVLKLKPSSVFAEVRDELALVDEMISLLKKGDTPDFTGVTNIKETLHRSSLEGSTLTSDELLNVLRFITASRNLHLFFTKRRDAAPMLSHIAENLFQDKTLEYHIDRVIDEAGNVRDSASKELRDLRRAIIEKSGHLRRRLDAILKKISSEQMAQEELITLRDGRMVLPVKVEHKKVISGFIHSSSASGQTVYIEPAETFDLNNQIRELEIEELRELHKILTELTSRVRAVYQEINTSVSLVTEFDAIYARARYALEQNAACPLVKQNGFLEINFGKHPVLLQHKKQSEVVPLSITLGENFNTIIITGPNAGGKSVAMKTVGLLALMVQSGIPITADSTSQFPIYHNIAVDIGDEQSVENDLSTFSSHIQRLSKIVNEVDEKTLILVDEIGTGTDPAEGSALGAAILQRLTDAGAHVIATTHHGMLKAFADQHPKMQNAAMEFDLTTLKPTYRFRCGLPGSSYAFEITKRHGMDETIILHARELLGSQTQSLEHLLSEVEKRSQLLGQQLMKLETDQKRLDALLTDYNEKNSALKRETKTIRKAAIEEAENILANANALIEKTIREIREHQASKEVVKIERQSIQELNQKLRESYRDLQTAVEDTSILSIHKNDIVAMKDNPSMQGTVLEEPKEGYTYVAFGSIKLKTEVEKLVKGERTLSSQQLGSNQFIQIELPSNEIDIRGMYGDEAIRTLDTFLYEAFTLGLKRVDIIHGKGTGALRKRVHTYLKDISFVESYTLANWNEGGSGMTVVMLK